MYYSSIGMLALMVLVIENYDIIFIKAKNYESNAWKKYRTFLYSVLLFYIADILYGVFLHFKLRTPLFLDTTLFFIAIAVGMLLWTNYIVAFLNEDSVYERILQYFGRIFFVILLAFSVINIFTPLLFTIDEQCVYHENIFRTIQYAIQIVLLVSTSVYTLTVSIKRKNNFSVKYATVFLYGLLMSVFIFLQTLFPNYPLYTVGYMMSTTLLHTFVVNDEKEGFRRELKESFEREKRQHTELESAKTLAYRDALTGVKSKLAYVEFEENKDVDMRRGVPLEFAVAVFDLNGLKETNDRFGHTKGDELLVESCRIICDHFKHSPVFRLGGDEFAAVLEGKDYKNRHNLESTFIEKMKIEKDFNATVAMGMADYIPGTDKKFNDVFERADKQMYERKRVLSNSDNQ